MDYSDRSGIMIADCGADLIGVYIYKLISNDNIVYIGQTSQLKKRIQNHIKYKEFDRIEVELTTKDLASNREAELIIKHKPMYNKSLPANSSFIHIGTANRKLAMEVMEKLEIAKPITINNKNPMGNYRYIHIDYHLQVKEHIESFKFKPLKEVKR